MNPKKRSNTNPYANPCLNLSSPARVPITIAMPRSKKKRQTPWENKGSQVFRGTLLRANISHLGKITFPATCNGDMCDISHKLSKLVDFFEKKQGLISQNSVQNNGCIGPVILKKIDDEFLGFAAPGSRPPNPKLKHMRKKTCFTLRQIIGWRGLQWKFAWRKIGHHTQNTMLFSNFEMNTLLFSCKWKLPQKNQHHPR